MKCDKRGFHARLLPICLAGALVPQGCGGGGSGGDGDNGGAAPPPPVLAGTITLFAGGLGGPGNRDGVGAQARFDRPQGVAVDAAGNVYVADTGSNRIRKITPRGVVSTVTGPGDCVHATAPDGSPLLCEPTDLAIDPSGNLLVIGRYRGDVVRVEPDGSRSLFASAASANTPNSPRGIAVDPAGFVYLTVFNTSGVFKFAPTGAFLATLAGGAGSRLGAPGAIAVDAASNVFVADTQGRRIAQVTPTGAVSTAVSGLDFPSALAINAAGDLVIGDGSAVFVATPAGAPRILAGARFESGWVDGPGTQARFGYVPRLAVDRNGVVFVADTGNNVIRQIDPAGNVTTTAGLPAPGSLPRFGPYHATDAAGNVYVVERADTGLTDARIDRISPDGTSKTLATGLSSPQGLALDRAGNLYFVNSTNQGCSTPAACN